MTSKGIGTRFLGLQKDDDGKLFATKWFVIVFIPVFPLFSAYIKVNKTDNFFSDHTVIEKTEHRFTNIIKTYIYGCIIFPVFMFGPIFFADPMFFSMIGIRDFKNTPLFQIIVIAVVVWVVIAGIILIKWDLNRRQVSIEEPAAYKISG